MVGQRGNLPVYDVRPEGQTGKPRVLHRNLLLPCTFLPVDPIQPPLYSIRETVSTCPSKTVAGRPQTYEFGASESGDENEPSGLLPPEVETLQMSARTGDPERLVADQPEQNTNEVMTEDVETPHHEVTDEPVLPDSEAEDDLVTEQETEQNHCHPTRARRPPNVLCYDQLGNPSYHPCSASSVQVPAANIVPGQMMYSPHCPPWLVATPYYYGSPSLQNYGGPSFYVPVHPHTVPWYPLNTFQCMQFPVC